MKQKTWKMTETLANGYSYESTQLELSNEYQQDRVSMVFKNLIILVLCTKVALALEGLRCRERVWEGGGNGCQMAEVMVFLTPRFDEILNSFQR